MSSWVSESFANRMVNLLEPMCFYRHHESNLEPLSHSKKKMNKFFSSREHLGNVENVKFSGLNSAVDYSALVCKDT